MQSVVRKVAKVQLDSMPATVARNIARKVAPYVSAILFHAPFYCCGLHRSEASIVQRRVKHNGQYWATRTTRHSSRHSVQQKFANQLFIFCFSVTFCKRSEAEENGCAYISERVYNRNTFCLRSDGPSPASGRGNACKRKSTYISLLNSTPKSPKNPNLKKSQILFCKILKNKWYHAKVLPKRFHLNSHTIGFSPQTQKALHVLMHRIWE